MKHILLAIAFIVSIQCRGQITFIDTNTPWDLLSSRAKQEDKLIFIHFENSECVQCNDVASKGFNGAILKDQFADNFVSIRCNVATPNGQKLAQKFRIRSSLMSLFVDPEGNILHVNNGSTSSSETYLNAADVAIGRKGKKQLVDFDKEYKAGERSTAFLKEYMLKRQETAIPYDELLDEYVLALSPDSLRNFQIVLGIFEMAPSLNSYAYKAIQKEAPRSLIDSIYNSSLPEKRKALNDGIIENSFRNAVRERNEEFAYRVALFTRDTYDDEPARGEIASMKTMVRYYYMVRDTARYLAHAQRLMDSKYMPLTIDSLNAMDDAAFKVQTATKLPASKNPVHSMQVRAFGIMPPSQFIYHDLNEHAYHFYELTRDKALLEKALGWSKKSMELADGKAKKGFTHFKLGFPDYMDTYAKILYRLDRRDEAITWQEKAVEAQKITGMAHQYLEIPLNKMKAGTL